MSKETDKHIINLFKNYDGVKLIVTLDGWEELIVNNIAWGYDIGDDYAHITSNCSPDVDGTDMDFFYTNEITSINIFSSQKVIFTAK